MMKINKYLDRFRPELPLRGLGGLSFLWGPGCRGLGGFVFVFLFGITGHSQTLEDYLQIAAERNPQIRSSYAQFEAAMQRAPQVASLEDPTLTMSAFGTMMETRLGPQMARFTLMQMFPWFGTLKAREDVASLMAEAAFQEYLDQRNQVFYELKSVYAEIYALEKTLQLKEENIKILDSYRELALSRFRGGSSPMVNVVRVDIKRDEAITEIELLRDSKIPLQTRFNLMLRRDVGEGVIVQDSLTLKDLSITSETQPLFDEHPIITRLERQRLAYEAEQTLAQKEGLPKIGLGVDYNVIGKRTDANPEMNGQDAVMPMVSVTLPIFRKKIKAAVKEAEFREESVREQQEAGRNELLYGYEMAIYEVNRAKKLIALYEKQVESSEQANSLLISGFSNSITDFDEVLQMNQDIILYRSQLLEAVKDGLIANARLEYLLSKNE